MGINRDRRFAKGGIEDNVSRFPTDTRERLQLLARAGNVSGVFFQYDSTGLDDVAGFGVVKADGLDVALEVANT